jgi:Cu(I)/Ag(I) efflux system periplasmic protein CusF
VLKLLFTAFAAGVFAMSPALAQMKHDHHSAAQSSQVHKGTGVVTSVDRNAGKVTLKHDPIKTLNWPSMTMGFAVKDKALLDNVAKDRKVDFEFVQEGKQYVITSIK